MKNLTPPFSDRPIGSKGTRLGNTEQIILRMFLQTKILKGRALFNFLLTPTDIQHSQFADQAGMKLWAKLKSKRIDCLLENNLDIWILEVKDVVRPNAIGQLLVYKAMYESQFKPVKPVKLGIIAGMDDLDVRRVAQMNDINIFIVNFNPHDHRFDMLMRRR